MGKKMTFPELAARIRQKAKTRHLAKAELGDGVTANRREEGFRPRKFPKEWLREWMLDVPIREVINRQIHLVQEQVSFESASESMVENRLNGLVVVDEDGQMKGYLPALDALEFYADRGDTSEPASPSVKLRRGGAYSLGGGFHIEELEQVTVAELMYPVTFVLREDEPLVWGIELLLVSGLPELAVLSKDNQILGTLSFTEIGAWLIEPRSRPQAPLAQSEINKVKETKLRLPARGFFDEPRARQHRIIA